MRSKSLLNLFFAAPILAKCEEKRIQVNGC